MRREGLVMEFRVIYQKAEDGSWWASTHKMDEDQALEAAKLLKAHEAVLAVVIEERRVLDGIAQGWRSYGEARS